MIKRVPIDFMNSNILRGLIKQMTKTIVFVETTKSGSSREALKAAHRLCFFTVLITENKRFVTQPEEFPEVNKMIHLDTITVEGISEEIRKLQQQGRVIQTVISLIDPFVSKAAKLSNEFCGTDLSVSAIEKMEDKTLTRETLKYNSATPKFHIYDPKGQLVSFVDNYHDHFPIILKSPFSKASRDVYLAENKIEMEKMMRRLLKTYPTEKILVEEYLIGPQYLVEVVVSKGKVNIIAIVKQEITKKTAFIITGYEIRVELEKELFNTLEDSVHSIIEDIKLENGGCHFEFRHINGKWMLIEINPRISGGAMNRMIEEAFGINLVEETIKLYTGNAPNLERKFEKHIFTHYITIGSTGRLLKVAGTNHAINEIGVKEVYIKPSIGDMLTPPTTMGHRYGYVMATGETSEEARENALRAARHIKFYLEAF